MKNAEKYIESITQATISKKIIWDQENPTTFYTTLRSSKGDEALFSIQKIRSGDYIFQVLNITRNETVISIDTSGVDYILEPQIRDICKNLYSSIIDIIEKTKLDFLDDLLGQI